MKKLFYTLLIIPAFVLAQSTDQNYVKSTTYKQATTTTVTNPDITTANVQVSYFDGLGRPIQQVAHKQSNSGKDIITHIEYDQFGRQTKEYLPYVSSSASLNYLSSASSDLLNFYASPSLATTGNPDFEATTNPFSEKQLENSPLNRVFKQAAPGNPWAMGQGKEIKFDYQTNSFEEVKYFKVTASWDASKGLYNPAIVQTSYYSENQLYKTITKDENWTTGKNNTTEEFKDKEGKVVLKRTFANVIVDGALVESEAKHDTYYIYDQFGNLTYVIPPLAEGVASEDNLNYLGYQYKYDSRNRLVEKKLPGKQWEFIVYDKLDRPVATGPAFSPYGDQSIGWMITEYDVFGRVTQTGWKAMPVSETDRNSNQTTINSGTNPFTLTTSDILTQNFYDNYNFAGAPGPLPTPVENQTLATNVKGMPTGSWVKVLDNATSTTAEVSYTLYDSKYRPIHTKTTNYLGGYTQVDTHLDWAGKTLYTLTKHKRTSSSTELVVKDMFEYTDQDKLALHKQQIVSSPNMPEQLIAKNTYDELGQLISKNVGGEDATGGTSLQTVDYSYNIRGWLKTINDVNTIGNDLFAFKINYNTPETATPLFNGNISETFWKTSTDDTKRKYDYSYDHLNRLLQADYSKEGNTTFNSYLEQLTYDKNGNIQSLVRNGNMDTDGMQFENPIDNLTYLYDDTNKNQLLRVFDATSNTQGFKDDTDGTDINQDISEAPDYAYDANGNMNEDKNKGIESIVYNHLNLPVEIVFPTGKITYLYNAVGQKVRKTVEETGITTTTDYLSGCQYKNAVLQFFPHAEGYLNATESTTKGVGYIFNYVFNYTDHLGNIRLSYSKDPATNVLKIIEENHYYPFGLKHTGYNSDQLMYSKENEKLMLRPVPPLFITSYSKKYNGQSWDSDLGINITAMDYRQYDNALGRFYGMDRLSEMTYSVTPYRFGFNNPVVFADPTGLIEEGGNTDMGWVNTGSTIFWDPTVNNQDEIDKKYVNKGYSYVQNNEIVTDINGENIRLNDDGTTTTMLNDVVVSAKRTQKTAIDYFGDVEKNYNGIVDYTEGIGLPLLGQGFKAYNNNYGFVNRQYYNFYKSNKGKFNLPKPGQQRQVLKNILSTSKFSKASKLIKKAGAVGVVLTVSNITVDGSDGSLKASSIIDGSLLIGGATASAVFPPAAPFIAAGILIYGIADYTFDINDTIDNKTNEVKIFD